MTITATVLAHSVFKGGKPLMTFELLYPRFIHAELMTYRVFSRNASSSRAIPISTMMEMIRKDTAMPMSWGLNGAGMQAHGELDAEAAESVKKLWLAGRDAALQIAGKMLRLKSVPHKQIVNRILEPYAHIRVVVTSTEWANFYAQRRSPNADPTIKALADAMWAASKASTPTVLQPGEWHLPYIHQYERDGLFMLPEDRREDGLLELIKISVARCARTSYKNHRNKISTRDEDLELFAKLVSSPIPGDTHASPAEHQATPDTFSIHHDRTIGRPVKVWASPQLHGNLSGYVQFRKTLNRENVTSYDPPEEA